MYASRFASGEIAIRVTYEAPGEMVSVESKVRSYRSTGRISTGCIQLHAAVARSRAATTPPPYVNGRTHVVDHRDALAVRAADNITAGFVSASANSCADANRSAGVFSSARATASGTCAGKWRLTVFSDRGYSVIIRAMITYDVDSDYCCSTARI